MRPAIALLFCSSFAACAPAEKKLVLLPDADDVHESLILVIEREAGRAIWAADAHAPFGPLELEVEGDDVAITGIYFEQTLDALGLESGAVSETNEVECGHRSLEDGARFWRVDDAASSRRELEALPPSLEDLWIKVPCPCVQFRVLEELPLPSETQVRFQTPLDGRRAAIVSHDYVVVVDENLGVLSSTTTAYLVGAGARTSDRAFWLGTMDGRIYRGFSLDALSLYYNRPGEELHWGVGSTGNSEAEAFFMNSAGIIYRATEDALEPIVTERSASDGDQYGSIAWLSSGRLLATQREDFGMLDIDLSRTPPFVRQPWALELGAISSVAAIDGVSYLATRTARVFRRGPEGWAPMPRPPEGVIRGFTAYRGGFVGVGEYGFVVQYHPTAGFCRSDLFARGLDLHFATAVGDNLIVTGSRANPLDEPEVVQRAVLIGE